MGTAGHQGDSLEVGGSGRTQHPTHALVDGQQDRLHSWKAARKDGEGEAPGDSH